MARDCEKGGFQVEALAYAAMVFLILVTFPATFLEDPKDQTE